MWKKYLWGVYNKLREVIVVSPETTNYGEVDSIDFAIYLNQRARAMSLDVNVTKIQKWVYICYGIYLAAHNRQLLSERPKAWDFGPAFPRVHNKQKKNGGSLDGINPSVSVEDLAKFDDIIIPVLEHFGKWTASGLVEWTHAKGTAWDKNINRNEKYKSMDNHDILLDFERFVLRA